MLRSNPLRALLCCLSIIVMIVTQGCTTVRQYNLQDGIRSFRVQDYRHAFIRLKPEAEKGQRDAQYAVGYMYYYGQGVVENRKKACIWISRAAKAGQPEALIAIKKIRALPSSHPLESNARRVLQ